MTTTTIITNTTISNENVYTEEAGTCAGGVYKLRKLMTVHGSPPRRNRLFLTGSSGDDIGIP